MSNSNDSNKVTPAQTLENALEITDISTFAKTPAGYKKRCDASLAQLCRHANPIVRQACAESPLIQDKFIIMMYNMEKDENVKAILFPRYEAAAGKQSKTAAKIAAKDDEIKALKARLEKANEKKATKS